jgi:hypothetical protein
VHITRIQILQLYLPYLLFLFTHGYFRLVDKIAINNIDVDIPHNRQFVPAHTAQQSDTPTGYSPCFSALCFLSLLVDRLGQDFLPDYLSIRNVSFSLKNDSCRLFDPCFLCIISIFYSPASPHLIQQQQLPKKYSAVSLRSSSFERTSTSGCAEKQVCNRRAGW